MQQGSSTSLRGHGKLGLKILAGMIVIAAPVYVTSLFVPGIFSVAFFGVLAATFGWISGGPKIGAAVVGSLSVLGSVAILLRDYPWVLAVLLVLLGMAYGYGASRGVGKVVLQLPILTPYFMMSPPALFNNPPTLDLSYFVGLIVIMNVTGLWAIAVLHLATGARALKPIEVPDRRVPLLFGTLLGVISATVMLLGTTTELKSHWVWVILTIYVLADPTHLLTPKQMLGRVAGTFAGFAFIGVLALAGLPDPVLHLLAIPAVWLCLFFLVLKRPYWQYSFFLTVSVIAMNSSGVNTRLLNAERFGFTIVGACLAMLIALAVHFTIRHRAGIVLHDAEEGAGRA
ncbi:FUSC family protein [Leucobacter sp. HY1908]